MHAVRCCREGILKASTISVILVCFTELCFMSISDFIVFIVVAPDYKILGFRILIRIIG